MRLCHSTNEISSYTPASADCADVKPSPAPAGSGCPMRWGHVPIFDSFSTGPAGLLESYQSGVQRGYHLLWKNRISHQ